MGAQISRSSIVVGFLVAGLFAGQGHAEPGGDIIELAAPLDGAVDVATNAAVIWRFDTFVSAPFDSVVPTASAGGTPIALAVTRLEASTAGEGFLIARPEGGLWPASSSVAVTLGNVGTDVTFLTGAAAVVVDAPAAPVVSQVGGGGFVFYYFGFDRNFFAIVDNATGPADLLLHDFGLVGGERPEESFTGTGNLVWSITGEWLDPSFGAQMPVRFAALQVDGSVSPWSAPLTLRLPTDRDCDGVDDGNDDCPDEPGASGQVGDPSAGCPSTGPAEFGCGAEATVCTHRPTGTSPFGPHPVPPCAEAPGNGEGSGEGSGEGESDGEGDGGGGATARSGCFGGGGALVLLLVPLRRRRR